MPTPMVVVEPRPDKLTNAPEPLEVPPHEVPRAKKPRRFLRGLGWIVAIMLLWSAWAAYSLYDLSRALDKEDAVALARRIDWIAVRDGLRDDLRATSSTIQSAATAERPIEAMLAARSLVHLIRDGRFTDAGWETAAAPRRPDRGFQWLRVRYAFFSGGPFAIRVDIRPDSDTVRKPLVLLMRWNGDWRLERVFLPTDSRLVGAQSPQNQAAAPGTAASASAASDAPAAPSAAGAVGPKVVLYEEDEIDPNGKSYTGSVIWRTAQTSPAPGQPAEPEIRAEVDVPDKPMKLTLAIRRNADRNLPASHIVDVRITVPPDSSTGGIQDVPAIMMKTDENSRSAALSGVSVKVSNDYFMIGLSSSDENLRLNVDLLRQRPWFDVPIRYQNTRRAILAIEKGEAGAKAVEAALASWSNAASAEAKR